MEQFVPVATPRDSWLDTLLDPHPHPVDEAYAKRRDDRWAAKRTIWRISDQKRLALCGRVGNGQGIEFRVLGTPGQPGARAGISGVQTCGSVWACPTCSEKINAKRQRDIETGVSTWIEVTQGPACSSCAGWDQTAIHESCREVQRPPRSVSFVTLTLQHSACNAQCAAANNGECEHSLTRLWDAVTNAWRKGKDRVAWKGSDVTPGIVQRFGVAGTIRLAEVKYSTVNGWHPHLHVLVFHDQVTTADEREQLRHDLFALWTERLALDGYGAVAFSKGGKAVGVDVRSVESAAFIADYMAKNLYGAAKTPDGVTSVKGASYEVTGSHSKKAGKGGRTPFEILAGIVAHDADWTVLPDGETWVNKRTGEMVTETEVERSAQDRALWMTWEKASKGRRQLTWSKGLRDLLGLDTDVDDESVVDEAVLKGDPVDLGAEAPISDIMSDSTLRRAAPCGAQET